MYKKANKIECKTAKRRYKMELRNLVVNIFVVDCEGNLEHFKTLKKMVGITSDHD
jgi:hypothetical protein